MFTQGTKRKVIATAEKLIGNPQTPAIIRGKIQNFLDGFKVSDNAAKDYRETLDLITVIERECISGNYDAASLHCDKLLKQYCPNLFKKDSAVNDFEVTETKLQECRDIISELRKAEKLLAVQLSKNPDDGLREKLKKVRLSIADCEQTLENLEEQNLKLQGSRIDHTPPTAHEHVCYCKEPPKLSDEEKQKMRAYREERRRREEERRRIEQERSPLTERGKGADKRREKITLDKVNFSAVARKTFEKGEYAPVNVIMYEEEYRGEVDKIIAQEDAPAGEVSSGIKEVKRDSEITVALSALNGVEIDESVIKQAWKGKYLNFSFLVCVPEDYDKKQIVFTATIYIDAVIAAKLKFIAKCASETAQQMSVTRSDIKSAFISYSSRDRNRVASIIQGIKTARPDVDLFFDVDSLRRGENWESRLYSEIDSRDVLYLCWSRNARDSEWVNMEWRRAYSNGGEDKIEPIPIEPPYACPPPEELNNKHFNDKMIYYAYELKL